MNAKTWFDESIEAAAKALDAKSEAERQRHGRNAIDATLAAASLGHPDAMYAIGMYYQHGAYGIIRARLDLAEHWIRLAIAAANDGTGMLGLATLLMQTDRREEGRRWLRKALAHGEGGAACHLAREFEDSAPARALRLYLKGAALGDPFAAYCAGTMLEARGTRKALLQAEALLEKALGKIRNTEEALERVHRKLKTLGSPKPKQARERPRSPSRRVRSKS
jgi:TPR repeat protein